MMVMSVPRVFRLAFALLFVVAGAWDGTLCPSTGRPMSVSNGAESDCAAMTMVGKTVSPTKSRSGGNRSRSSLWPTCCVGHVISIGWTQPSLTLATDVEHQQVSNAVITSYVSPVLLLEPPPPKA